MDKFQAFLDWLEDNAQSPAFWKALIGFMAAAGLVLSPDQASAIMSMGMASMAVINTFKHVNRNK